MGRFFLNLIKFLLLILVIAVLGIAIYTMFFDPTTPQNEVTRELELGQ